MEVSGKRAECEWMFACPGCGAVLVAGQEAQQRCPAEGVVYQCIDGIWHFLRPDRVAFFARFIREYETVRRAEGRGDETAAYYRSLPFSDVTGRRAAEWQVRAQSFRTLLRAVVEPLESRQGRPLRILDLGAGNGWLSYQLAKRGHCLVAVDLTLNAFDGLGAHVHYDLPFTPIQAEFDHLPLADQQADLVIFNASLHYTPDYARTLREAWRVLVPAGQVVVVDTPVYRVAASGAQMVRERQAHFQAQYGFPSNAIASENYLTYRRLDSLAHELSMRWRLLWPLPLWRRTVRRWRTRLRRQREPAQFPLLIAQRTNNS